MSTLLPLNMVLSEKAGPDNAHADKTSLTASDTPPIPHCYGLDEAGRGCLAGPVVAAVVLFSPATGWGSLDELDGLDELNGLDDSKKLSAAKRAALAPRILQQAAAYGIGLSWQQEVDEINIVNATFRAMCRAIILMERNFTPLPKLPAYIDGNLLIREDAWNTCAATLPSQWHTPYFPLLLSQASGQTKNNRSGNIPDPPLTPPNRATTENLLQTRCHDTQVELRGFPFPCQKALVGGDGLLPAIAAASILAKTTRDSLMERLDARFPQYGFAKHKGYGTRTHQEAIRQYGPCELHRRTFIQSILGTQKQLPLFQED